MGPDEEVERDDKVTTQTDDRGPESVRDNKPVSVRDSLREAIRENDDDDASDIKDDKKITAKSEKKKPVKLATEIDDNDEEDAGDDDTSKPQKEKVVKEEIKTEPVVAEEKKTPAPANLPKEVTENWDKLPSNVQTYLTKQQKELTDAKSNMGRMQAHTRDLDAVLTQYEPAIRQLGVTPAQTVDRLFQWMNALAGPHKNVAIRQLAESFGISLEQSDQTQDNSQQQQQQVVSDPRIDALIASQQKQEQQLQQQRERSAASTVNNWAGLQSDGTYKNKPHYGKVRNLMANLLAGGTIPMLVDPISGEEKLDLDAAYDAAVYANTETRALLEQEKQEEAKKEAEAKKQQNVQKLKAAKNAGSSIKPGAPAGNPNANPLPKKGQNGTVSVRDSIRHAIRENVN